MLYLGDLVYVNIEAMAQVGMDTEITVTDCPSGILTLSRPQSNQLPDVQPPLLLRMMFRNNIVDQMNPLILYLSILGEP